MSRGLVALSLLLGCQEPGPAVTVDERPQQIACDAESLAVHQSLFVAAERGDVAAFRATLSVRSLGLLDAFFAAAARRSPFPTEPPLDWAAYLAIHTELPAEARTRCPYVLVLEEGGPRLDLAGHVDARFYAEVARR